MEALSLTLWNKRVSKRIFAHLSILVIISCISCASMQVVPPADRVVQKIHKVNLTKDEIYSGCLAWMAETFVDSKDIIQLRDKGNGKIIGKGITSFKVGEAIAYLLFPCRFTLIVEIKENKYRTTYKNFIGMWGEHHNEPSPLEVRQYVDQVKVNMLTMDRELYAYLAESKNADKW